MSWSWIVLILIVLAFLIYPIRNGGSVCDAARGEILEQVPPAIDILAARYPVRVGVLRSVFNQQGTVDSIAKEYVATYMQEHQQNPGPSGCYVAYYGVAISKDRVRTAMADWLEKQLNLK